MPLVVVHRDPGIADLAGGPVYIVEAAPQYMNADGDGLFTLYAHQSPRLNKSLVSEVAAIDLGLDANEIQQSLSKGKTWEVYVHLRYDYWPLKFEKDSYDNPITTDPSRVPGAPWKHGPIRLSVRVDKGLADKGIGLQLGWDDLKKHFSKGMETQHPNGDQVWCLIALDYDYCSPVDGVGAAAAGV